MFTSRAEYRLRLRTDNARRRLTPAAIAAGLVTGAQQQEFEATEATRAAARLLLDSCKASPARLAALGLETRQDGVVRSAFEWLRFPVMTADAARRVWPELATIPAALFDSLMVDANYASYLDRQAADVANFRRDEALSIPAGLDYRRVPGLSNEMAERLMQAQPATLGAAGRIPGITPAALVALLPFTRKAA
jgi:tRNA uridine 5-carboxymethylaminomethyl modification enzyme